MNIDELTVGQVKQIAAMAPKCGTKASALPFKAGDAILIRTVTMALLGRVKAIGRDLITLEDGGWVADTGRFGDALAKGTLHEFERAPSWFAVGRGSIVDVWPWTHDIPKASK